MRMGTYHICKKCLAPITRNEVEVRIENKGKKEFLGYFHRHCAEEVAQRKNSKYFKRV